MKRIFSRELVMMIVVLGLATLAANVLQPILPLYLTSLGVTPALLGLILSMSMAGMIVGESSWGWVGDRLGLKLPLSTATLGSGLMLFFFVWLQGIPSLFPLFFFWGLSRSAVFPVNLGYFGVIAPSSQKGIFMALFFVILAASRSLGALMSGFIVDNLGYHQAFFIAAGIALLGGIVFITTLGKMRRVKPEPTVTSPSPEDIPLPPEERYNYRSFTLQSGIAALFYLGQGISMTFLPLLATQVIGVSATEVGILFTIKAVVTLTLGMPMGMLADRWRKRDLMIFALLISAAGLAGIALVETFGWLIGAVFIASLGATMFTPAAFGLLSSSMPVRRQSTAMGIYSSIGDAGMLAGSALGGFVWSAWGPEPTFLMGVISAGLGAGLCFLALSKDKVSKSP